MCGRVYLYPTPAACTRATSSPLVQANLPHNSSGTSFQNDHQPLRVENRTRPGTLPESAAQLSNASRGLLMRLLECDPKVRMRSLRQLQQSAFYMGFHFEHVKTKKVTPRSILERLISDSIPQQLEQNLRTASQEVFALFDQPSLV